MIKFQFCLGEKNKEDLMTENAEGLKKFSNKSNVVFIERKINNCASGEFNYEKIVGNLSKRERRCRRLHSLPPYS